MKLNNRTVALLQKFAPQLEKTTKLEKFFYILFSILILLGCYALYVQETEDVRQLHLLKYGRHFRLNDGCKLVVGRSKRDNEMIMNWFDKETGIRLRHTFMAGPDALLFGEISRDQILTAARIMAGYIKSKPGEMSDIYVFQGDNKEVVQVTTPQTGEFQDLMIQPK